MTKTIKDDSHFPWSIPLGMCNFLHSDGSLSFKIVIMVKLASDKNSTTGSHSWKGLFIKTDTLVSKHGIYLTIYWNVYRPRNISENEEPIPLAVKTKHWSSKRGPQQIEAIMRWTVTQSLRNALGLSSYLPAWRFSYRGNRRKTVKCTTVEANSDNQ